MDICYITNLYRENARGGAERIVALEAGLMMQAGHKVRVISGAARGWESKKEEKNVDRVYPWNLYPYADGKKHTFLTRLIWHLIDMRNTGTTRKIGRIVDTLKPDVVHTHNLMGLGFRIPKMLRKRKVRHVHTVHDVQLLHPSGLLTDENPGVFGNISRKIYQSRMRRLMGSPHTVIFPSHYLADLHKKLGFFPESKIVVLSNPAPDVTVMNSRTIEDRFVFVGQLEWHKGVSELVDAWLASKPSGAFLDIVGTGLLEEYLRDRIKDRDDIVMHGRLDEDQVNEIYDRATFVVVPSRVMENQPTVILEAFSRGVPVIASDMGGISELVKEGETGFLFDVTDEQGIPDALARARASGLRSAWDEMSSNVKERVRVLGKEPHKERLISLYKE